MRPSARPRRSIGASRIRGSSRTRSSPRATIHRRARRRARARAALREALESFAFLGARLWATQAREQLGTHRCRARAGRTDADPAPGRRARRERPDESEDCRPPVHERAHGGGAPERDLSRARHHLALPAERGAVRRRDHPPGFGRPIPGFDTVIDPVGSRNFALRLQGRCSTQSSPGPSGDRSRSEPMAQATQAESGNPAGPKLSPRRGRRDLAAILVAGILAFAAIDPFGRSRRSDPAINPAVLESGVQWELQRQPAERRCRPADRGTARVGAAAPPAEHQLARSPGPRTSPR